MHRKRQPRLCRNAVEPWGIPEMITREALQSSANFLYLSPHVEITLSHRTKSSNCYLWASDEWHFFISDIIYGVKIPSLLPLFQLFQSNQRLFSLCLLLGGAGGRRDRWYRLQKESWEITHISFSFVANLMPRFLLEVRSATQAQRRTRAGEASHGGQCSKLPWADPTAEHGSYYTLAAILFFPYGVSDLSCTLR